MGCLILGARGQWFINDLGTDSCYTYTTPHYHTQRGSCIGCHSAIFHHMSACAPAPRGETTEMVIRGQEVECIRVSPYWTTGDCFCGIFSILLRGTKHFESLYVLCNKTALMNQGWEKTNSYHCLV